MQPITLTNFADTRREKKNSQAHMQNTNQRRFSANK